MWLVTKQEKRVNEVGVVRSSFLKRRNRTMFKWHRSSHNTVIIYQCLVVNWMSDVQMYVWSSSYIVYSYLLGLFPLSHYTHIFKYLLWNKRLGKAFRIDSRGFNVWAKEQVAWGRFCWGTSSHGGTVKPARCSFARTCANLSRCVYLWWIHACAFVGLSICNVKHHRAWSPLAKCFLRRRPSYIVFVQSSAVLSGPFLLWTIEKWWHAIWRAFGSFHRRRKWYIGTCKSIRKKDTRRQTEENSHPHVKIRANCRLAMREDVRGWEQLCFIKYI